MRAWLCRRGWHGWNTWVGLSVEGRPIVVARVCARPGCDAKEAGRLW
ncbi:hypothetical protein GALAXY_62 [Arthrobacter phage Galaxy]|uniref:Uncharacterized protein n=1 Tax=Arthrobacter phage Galaxy TaxID=1772326 RepID=A0A0U4IKE9_9CAUD|nr:hypothetical protein FDG93_gp62 [Arthrobacter phage Galaxy]ALY08906.1 hypothetical protein GALAXY_62 [Arthrobacter phage Galaxy]